MTAGAGQCGGCGVGLHGRWCHACGNDSRPPARSARALLDDLLENVLSFTGAVPMTLKSLLLKPSLVPRAQLAGDRRRFLSPARLYVATSLLFFLFLAISGVSIFQVRVERTGEGPPVVRPLGTPGPMGFRMEERWLHPTHAAPRDAEVVAAFDRALPGMDDEIEAAYFSLVRRIADDPGDINTAISTWAPRVLWVMMPLHALLLWPLFRKGRWLADHLILSLWAHSLMFIALVVGGLWNMVGLTFGLAVAMAIYQVYFTLGLRGYYETSWPAAVLKAAVHSAVYIGLLWLPLTAAFFIVQAASGLDAS